MGTIAPNVVVGGRYLVQGVLGRGGMGTVYRAQHLTLHRPIALKVVEVATDELALRFEREARAIARLDHPGCVRVIDYGSAGPGERFLAMELIEGTTLSPLIAGGPLPIARALHITRRVLAALAHAHAHGVVHRDVKPDNIMLADEGGRVVLIDFGLAALADAPALTREGMCLGSPSYVAPERLLGRPHDARTDLYAVGVVLFEMLTGVRPFVGATPRAVMEQALARPPRPARALRPDISPALEAVLWRALAKDPARRFADAEDLRSALETVEELARVDAAEPDEDAADAALTHLALVLDAPPWYRRLWQRLSGVAA